MATIYGLRVSEVGELVIEIGAADAIAIAAWNAPDHCTITGEAALVRRALGRAAAAAAEVAPVEVEGPWHCRMVAGAARQVYAELRELRFARPLIPIYPSGKGALEDEPERLRVWLANQLAKPVLWYPIVFDLIHYAGSFVEIGPGRVLSDRIRRTLPGGAPNTLFAVERGGGELCRLPELELRYQTA
jgi:[acyl-carrier-protein] S-malonyltransferase